MKLHTQTKTEISVMTTPNRVLPILFYVCVASLALGQLGRYTTSWGGIYLHDLLIILWVFLVLIQTVYQTGQIAVKNFVKTILIFAKQHYGLMLFVGWVCLGWLWYWIEHSHLPLRGILYAFKLATYGFWGLYLVPKQISHKKVLGSLLFIQIIGLIFGLVFFALMPDARFLAILGWDDHYFRLVGIHLDPNITGIHLLMLWNSLIMTLLFFPQFLTPRHIKSGIFALLGLTSLALLLTFSRAAYLTWIVSSVGIIGLAMLQKHRYRLALVPITGLATLIVCGSFFLAIYLGPNIEGQDLFRTTSITARLGSAQTYLASLKNETWLLGTGLFVPQPSQLHADNRAFLPDSWPITLLVGSGLVGLTLGVLLIMHYLQFMPHSHPEKNVLRLLILITLFHALSINSLFYGFTWLWLCLAVGSTRYTY